MTAGSDQTTLPRDALGALQLERLRATVRRLLLSVPPVRERLHAAGVTSAEQVGSLADLGALPFATKADLREHYPFGLLAVEREAVARVHASSGTSGKPTVVAYTAADLEMWTVVMARSMAIAGVRPGMLVHNANGYGLFTGGLGFHQGAERLGTTVDPGVGRVHGTPGAAAARSARPGPDRDAVLRADHRPGAARCRDVARRAGARARPVRRGAVDRGDARRARRAARPAVDQLLRALGDRRARACRWSATRCATACTSTRTISCPRSSIPRAARVLPPGEEGELVFTTLTKEALPMLRYRTGDIATLIDEPCACGRTLRRMTAVRGRRDDMLIIRGVNLYPSTVEHVLVGVQGMSPHYQLVVERPGTMDELTVRCEPARRRRRPHGAAARACATSCARRPACRCSSSCARPGSCRAARARPRAWSIAADPWLPRDRGPGPSSADPERQPCGG